MSKISNRPKSKAKQAKLLKRWRATRTAKRLERLNKSVKFNRAYLFLCLAILFTTVTFWGVLGAKLQQNNSDQLVNAYLFQDAPTLHGATLPGQHSFLIKWPLFYAIKLFNYSPDSFVAATLLSVLLTVSLLVLVLWRIEKRPIVLGTISLALTSVLLLIPAQPYAGGLLPVNMAMLATRNLEYILFIGALILLARSNRIRRPQFWGGTALLGLLIVSDKLFLGISLIAALVSLVAYVIRRHWVMAGVASRYLVASLGAGFLAIILILLINGSGLLHLSSAVNNSPYGLTESPKALFEGAFYAVTGLFTNFGANPAYDALTIAQIPHQLTHNLFSVAGPAYLVNLVLVLFMSFLAVRFGLQSLGLWFFKKGNLADSAANRLALMLLWATLAALILFIATTHYYVVDARYLGVALFTFFICLSAWSRRQRLQSYVLLLTPILLASVLVGSIAAARTHKNQTSAYSNLNHRNRAISQTLASHKTQVLVGDYWRVLPIKQETHNRQTIVPLSGCSEAQTVLTSKTWNLDLHNKRFAYLLTLEGGLTNYPNCTLQEVTKNYGSPNSSALIAGSIEHPKELLLFYDRGIHKNSLKEADKNSQPSTVLPISLDEMPNTLCREPTIMSLVAHEDDDLLFMSPDLLRDIQAGHCLRTVYLTAGDAGHGASYWLSRQQGSEAAYSEMLGTNMVWIERIIKLPGGQFVTVANPKGNNKVSLVFMHLPDGNVHGEGFSASHNESLANLDSGHIGHLEAVDHQSVYSQAELVSALSDLMHTYQPAEIRTQSNNSGQQYVDHSDHNATGRIATKAYGQYEQEQYGDRVIIPITYYLGYPVHEIAENVADQELLDKQAAFRAYATYDGGVCHTDEQCKRGSVYGAYLARQYQSDY